MTQTPLRTGAELGEILIVEDDAGDAVIVEEHLRQCGGSVCRSESASLGVATRMFSPATSCILLDLGLPYTEGLDGLRHLVATAPRTPVIVLTGLADRAAREAAVRPGAGLLGQRRGDGEGLVRAVRYAIQPAARPDAARQLAEAGLLRARTLASNSWLLPRPRISNPALRW